MNTSLGKRGIQMEYNHSQCAFCGSEMEQEEREVNYRQVCSSCLDKWERDADATW